MDSYALDDERRVLIIDDDAVQRLIVQRIAQGAGLASDTAATLDEGKAHIAARSYAAVVLDLSLGAHDGIELLRDLADSESDVSLVFISGFDDRIRLAASRLAAALGLRVAGTLQKPLGTRALRALLAQRPDKPEGSAQCELDLTHQDLLDGLAGGQIVAHFQPKIDLKTGSAVGVESLARWVHPVMGCIPPDVFVSLAERTGLICHLTHTILEQSLAACAQWRHLHPDITVAVNLSPTVLDLSLPDEIETLREAAGVPPSSLVLEITEGVVAPDAVVATDVLTRLRIKGMQLSIDDFGTGHSSLLSLLRLPFGELKIDRFFVANMLRDPEASKIIRAVITLAREMDMRVVAEGIESTQVRDVLADRGCDYGQGWLWAPALPAAALAPWLQSESDQLAAGSRHAN